MRRRVNASRTAYTHLAVSHLITTLCILKGSAYMEVTHVVKEIYDYFVKTGG
jgi:hypothetical protein